ncbi:MAG: OmpA family protein [Deferrisomatales bacterium]
MNACTRLVALALALVPCLAAPRPAAASLLGPTAGQRLDDSRAYPAAPPPNGERSPAPGAAAAAPSASASAGSTCGGGASTQGSPLPFRITVDGEPLAADGLAPEADRQRCVDVALAQADVQVRFDPLAAQPALNAWSHPDGVARGEAVEFGAYANYLSWIQAAEIRVYAGDRPSGRPLAVVPARWDTPVSWAPPADAPGELCFVLRAYDRQGRFDETAVKPLRLLDRRRPHGDLEDPARERLVGWGQDSRRLANIPVAGGTVTVSGQHLRPGTTVKAFGLPVPVDARGAFAAQQILPAGPHAVSVELRGPDGDRAAFSRNLSIPDQDWFYVAIADLTVGQNRASGPVELVTGEDSDSARGTYVEGRGAFYLKGKIKGEYLLTATADTREQPFEDLFRNFSSKDPRYLLRRLDPDAYYPVYGDDSTLTEDAPTQGKFYVRLEKGDSRVLWGNFHTHWTGNDLTQFSRALYGGQVLLNTSDTTRHGERRGTLSGFAAEPGTLQAREEFRGTGGSLYYLNHLDVTQGSDRVWVETRDRDSGLVLERRQLVPAQDYDVNYLQCRILLRAALPSVTGGSTLVVSGSVPGNPVYLVVTYEYVPGVTAVDGLSYGGAGSYWLTDFLRLGVAGYRQSDGEQAQRVGGVDATVRYAPGTYLKAELARSEDPGAGQQSSIDGGFQFFGAGAVGDRANAHRIEGQVDLGDLVADGRGKASVYVQTRDQGFSGPGQLTPGEKTSQWGGRVTAPVTRTVEADLKADDRTSPSQGARNVEGAARWQFAEEWQAGLGVRRDDRWADQANASATLSEEGERTDVQGRLHYKPLVPGPDHRPGPAHWDLYGFAQATAARTGTRRENDRAGLGGGWQATDRLRFTAEASGGDGGTGGVLGGDYRLTDRSNAYLSHTMETERPGLGTPGRYGTTVAGSRYRLSDEMAVYGETRATNGTGPESLVNAFGLDLAPNDRWTYGVKGEYGVISDAAGGDLLRRALGLSWGYRVEGTKYAGTVEYRSEDGDRSDRRVWLLRNAASHRLDEEWRGFAKLNLSLGRDNRGAFYDGDFVEVVTGGAYRPIANDRWNALFKYTYFQDAPAPEQVTGSGRAADYSQRSHVVSADAIYDLVEYLSLGGKLGHRYSLLRPTKTEGDWFSSRAVLGVLRADLHLTRRWDAVGEARTLSVTEAQSRRSGFLTALYYHLDQHLKLGVGYNFSDFSDDLTDLSYRSRGWFLNVVGTL